MAWNRRSGGQIELGFNRGLNIYHAMESYSLSFLESQCVPYKERLMACPSEFPGASSVTAFGTV